MFRVFLGGRHRWWQVEFRLMKLLTRHRFGEKGVFSFNGKNPFSFHLRTVVSLWPSSTFEIVFVEKFDAFLTVVDLIGEGRVDLAVGFNFFPSLPFRYSNG